METKNYRSRVDEKTIVKQQYILFFAALISFIPLILLSKFMFNTVKYGLLIPFALMSYIGIISIKHHVSIMRLRGQMDVSRGRQAVIYGALTLIGAIANIIFVLTPFSDILFPY